MEILEEFYHLRMDYYDKRKKYLLEKLKKELEILESKVRFIDGIIKKKLDIFNKTKDNIVSILEKNKFIKLKDEPPFDYLIRMPFYSITKEKVQSLKEQFDKKQEEYNLIKKKKIENMWLDDLHSVLE